MLAAVAVAAVVALSTGCSVPSQSRAQVVDDRVPFGLLEPDAPPLLPQPGSATTEPVTLCFVRGSRLASVVRPLAAPVSLRGVLDALSEVAEGEGPDLRTLLAAPSIVESAALSAGLARLDLRDAVSALPGDEQLLAVAQLVCTLTARPGVGQVSFTLEGVPVEVPRGDGSVSSGPVSRDDYAALLNGDPGPGAR